MSQEITLTTGRHRGTRVFTDGGNVLCRHNGDDRDLIVYIGGNADIDLKPGDGYIYITTPSSNMATAIDTDTWEGSLVDMTLPPLSRHIRGIL